LTVDTEEDFDLINEIYETLYPANPAFTLTDVIALINARPELAALNEHVQQKAVR
jgi:spore coat polysaccharide biosynthesis protein SpsF